MGFCVDTMEDVLAEAAKSAEVTHNHPEEIKGAQAVALAIYLARNDANKEMIRIAGGIAEAVYGGLPEDIWQQTVNRLDPEMLEPLALFETKMQG